MEAAPCWPSRRFRRRPNYYFRYETNGVDPTKIGDIQKLFPIVNAKTDSELFADLDATQSVDFTRPL